MNPIKSRKHASAFRPLPLATASLAAGLGLAALPSLAFADSNDGARTLDKVDVHATRGYKADKVASPKFTQSLQDTPQTIQVITADLFNQQGATTLTEALRNSPGVGTFFVGENGNTATGDALYMRGFDTSSSLFVDGVRDLGSISRDVFNTEQVEITKGPAGTDNGRSAPTGAINMVSKQATLHDEVSGTASLGSDQQRRATADWNQSLGATSALRLNAVWQDSDQPGRDHVNNSRWGIAPSLAFGLGTDTRYVLNLLYVDQDNVPDGGVPTLGLPGWIPQPTLEALAGNPVDPQNFYGTRADHDDVSAKMATFRIEHDFNDAVRLTNTARWGRTEQDYLLTAFMGTGTRAANGAPTGNIRYTDRNDLSTYTIARSLPTLKDQRNTLLTDQLNLRADFATGAIAHNLSTGLEYTREEMDSFGQAVTGGSSWPAANLYAPDWNVGGLTWGHNGADAHGRTTTWSAYLFDTLHLGESLLLTAGVRADHYDTRYASSVVCGGRAGPACGTNPVGTVLQTPTLEASDTLLNWKLGVLYKAGDTASIYANYALSQQPPGGSNFALSSSASSLDNPRLDPQEAKTFEVGSKWAFLDDALALNLAIFQTDVENEINTQVLDDAGNPTQTGSKRVKGVELSAVGRVTENWSLSAGYSHLDTEVKEGANVAADGTSNLTYTPDDAFTAWSTYALPFGLTLGGGVRYSSAMHRGTDGAVGTPSFTKSYTVYDAVLSYAVNEALVLRLNAYNVFDKQYVAAINKSGYRYTPGTPRTFLLSADFRF
ncbi:catecholate siderophore receptor Fiu [Stenotrophomonas sp. SORGH_AS_0321]|uniref:catecholate siderophore receptor Fiu n=1 Tax=Stenotrophomonas sp. SORGH_AS_0321 TaxID=3041787 RepID=UPI0028567388|nr:catecholate siderophore receptor Fiu [Stenotrophomonas sp. SORGH_AS_0321]MDR6093586.1 catecholate siderophore receptor [Stenotrophomonas sp. SORGH_AS_0321]